MGSLACLLRCFLYVSHFPIMSSMSLFMPCQYKVSLHLLLHFSIPRCPSCSFCSTSSLRLSGMTIGMSLSNSPFATLSSDVIVLCTGSPEPAIVEVFHHSLQLLVFSSLTYLLYDEFICFDLASVTGRDSTIMFTWCSIYFSVALVWFISGAVESVLANTRCLPVYGNSKSYLCIFMSKRGIQ